MNVRTWICILASLALFGVLCSARAHTLFVNPNSFYFPVDEKVVVPLINGLFLENESKIAIGRLTSGEIVGPDGVHAAIRETDWRHDDDITVLETAFSRPGNHVVGVATKSMMVRMTASDFNFYLKYEGLHDDAREREQLNENGIDSAEKYAKFAKAILQVGEDTSENFSVILGHRVEIVPMQNPYDLKVGDTFSARILKDGKPIVGELVYASHENFYERLDTGIVKELEQLRSDQNGEVRFVISAEGRWYIRFIDLIRTGDQEHWYSSVLVLLGVEEPRIPYESLWATLTFEIR